MSQPINLVDVQFNAPNEERLRRLVEEVRKTQAQLNLVIQEKNALELRVAALEALVVP